MESGKEPFWLVWCDEGGAPTFKHCSYASAATEADRLARQNRGRMFHVLESVDARVTDDLRRIALRPQQPYDDGIPF